MNFQKVFKFQIHENPSTGSQVVPREGRADTQTEMMKLTVAIRNVANVPNKTPDIWLM
jgi:hypothetical protein